MDAPPILREFPTSFESKRLTIRRPEPGDGQELNAAVLETWRDLREWMPWAMRRPTVEESEEVVRKAHAQFVAREDLLLLLYLKGTGTLVGGSGLHRIDWKVPAFEIGYWCRERFQGKGYVTEAADAIAQFAFRELGARRVAIHCDAENERSARIPPRIGFTLEARLRNHRRHHLSGELRDTLVFSRTAPDPPPRRRR
jgi:RimJ/RimL family protein N-acetyltransferase